MCGIVGIYLKNPELRPRLGEIFSPMLIEMSERGPDSAGVAVYREDDAERSGKVIAYDPEASFDWVAIAAQVEAELGGEVHVERIASHVILRSGAGAAALREWIERTCPDLRITSSGAVLEIYKEVGLPVDVLDLFSIPEASGTHAVGHTRMATESAVTTEGAHPFNTGDDLCLVHNGSLSNHHRLREWLREHAGIRFQTENDSEVAAGYLTWRLRQGATIAEALEAALGDLDGFYTFAVGTREGFSVLRDPIACKPAVLAETDDWVAMASEYRALARLPGVEEATVWEPKPATVYNWGSA
jgi:glutamate synthase domain-containing protein 1